MAGPHTLLPLADVQKRLRVTAAVETLPVGDALGFVLAEPVHAPAALPAVATARRRGVAVAAAALVGASPYAPALLTAAPAIVQAGDALPPPADAVLPEDAVGGAGPFVEIGQAAYPGEGAILPGADAGRGLVLAAAGEALTSTAILALRLAEIDTVNVHRLVIALRPETESPAIDWLAAMLAAAGCRVVTAGPADLNLYVARDLVALSQREPSLSVAGLALNPCGEIAVGSDSLGVTPRFDSLAALYFALLWPFIAAKTGRRLRAVTRPLTRKLVSQVGLTEIALLRETADGYEPLTTGQITLAALIAADAVALVGPDAEGAASGAPFAATPIRNPFEPQ